MNDSGKLQNLLDKLNDLLFRTWSAFLVAKNFDPIIDSNNLVQGRYFCVTVYVSCVEYTILGFSKLMSEKKDEISVRYLLNICNEKPVAFANVDQGEVSNMVQRHQKQLTELKTLVRQVELWRDRAIAHLDRKYINDPAIIANIQPVDMEYIGESFILLQDIINVYREWLGMSLLLLQNAEKKMHGEWEYLVSFIQQPGQVN